MEITDGTLKLQLHTQRSMRRTYERDAKQNSERKRARTETAAEYARDARETLARTTNKQTHRRREQKEHATPAPTSGRVPTATHGRNERTGKSGRPNGCYSMACSKQGPHSSFIKLATVSYVLMNLNKILHLSCGTPTNLMARIAQYRRAQNSSIAIEIIQ